MDFKRIFISVVNAIFKASVLIFITLCLFSYEIKPPELSVGFARRFLGADYGKPTITFLIGLTATMLALYEFNKDSIVVSVKKVTLRKEFEIRMLVGILYQVVFSFAATFIVIVFWETLWEIKLGDTYSMAISFNELFSYFALFVLLLVTSNGLNLKGTF